MGLLRWAQTQKYLIPKADGSESPGGLYSYPCLGDGKLFSGQITYEDSVSVDLIHEQTL